MSRAPQSDLRNLPSVDRALRELGDTGLPRAMILSVIRSELAAVRASAESGGHMDAAAIMPGIRAAVDALRASRIRPVINATGIIVHTNFGRSPLAPAAIAAMSANAAGYNNLEYDLTDGQRGSRGGYVEHALSVLCNAEAATVVNNCAAALVLILRHFAARPPRNQVIISRGELVQIGGGFRIPEILQASGASLREVGTTNKTTLDDYRAAVDDTTAMILKVHRGNFYMDGFVQDPPPSQIAAVAHAAGVPFIEDLGSGATFDTLELGGGEHEPMPADALADGADLVCFSGDKLLGGPQAGIIAGAARHVAALKKEPFFRALRCDKLILSALEATAELLLNGQAMQVPIRQFMNVEIESLQSRARRIVDALADLPASASIVASSAQVGGGSLPRTQIPSVAIEIRPEGIAVDQLAKLLREGHPPLVGMVVGNAWRGDLRTVFEQQDALFISALRIALHGGHKN